MSAARNEKQPRIAVIGLGYVGLPLAVALSHKYPTVGMDVDEERVEELRQGHDRTDEVASKALTASKLTFTSDPEALRDAVDIYIITVPTPVDVRNRPDLGALIAASRSVGGLLKNGDIVVFESTVYPGVTEDVCGPILERESGLYAERDFVLGYSPERINPGDRTHRIDTITKVVAAQTEAAAETLRKVYGAVNGDDIFVARNIRTAEAAKVIENAQRDINIAFINEITMIFGRMGLSVFDVLEAANTKWNFLPFTPGLVGGHCIGVDPYYLAHAAEEAGHEPRVILSGRRINDAMSLYVADRIDDQLEAPSKVLVLGVTFKENVPDIRNSKVVDLIRRLQGYDHEVTVCDPLADVEETRQEYAIDIVASPQTGYDCVVGAVPHQAFDSLSLDRLLVSGGLVADMKGMWRAPDIPAGLRYWSL